MASDLPSLGALGPVLPEIVLAIAALVVLLVGVFSLKRERSGLLSGVAIAILLVVAIYVGLVGTGDALLFNGSFVNDGFARFMKVLVLGGSAFALLLSLSNAKENGLAKFEYAVLVMLATVGMMIMISANDLMTLYVGLELQSLAFYVTAAMNRENAKATEAGLKYFVLGALASGLLLYGASLVYGFTGQTELDQIAKAISLGSHSVGLIFGVVFLLAGIAFKIAAVPFHMWTPDVYEGAPTPVTTFFASAPKVAALALTARVALDAFGHQSGAWQQVVIFAALASIIVGALGAIGQGNLKRLLAYSSINNVGFILIGLACNTAQGAAAMLVYLAIYVPMTIGSFVAVLMLKTEDGEPVEAIADISGLATSRPAIAWCLMIMMFSLAGIPPLFGFWGKFVVFQAAVQAGLPALAAVGIAASVIGAFYYIKIVKVMFFDERADVVKGTSGWGHWALLAICAVFLSPLGYLLTPWLDGFAGKAASVLFMAV
ncbi:MAG TPA: NADH-quinone oxidoreductase subunit NuoN [Sphingomonadaceae bacterium]